MSVQATETSATGRGQLPVGPLVARVAARGGIGACLERQPDLDRVRLERTLNRAIVRGHLSLRTADTLSIKMLGLHPMLVWGDDWLD